MSESISATATLVAPILVGAWIHDPADVDATERNFLFVDDRSERYVAHGSSYRTHGREYPVAEFGDGMSRSIDATITLPFSDTHDVEIEWIRAAVRARRTLCYRDGRGRVVFGALLDGAPITDQRGGYSVAFKLTAVSYAPAV